MIDSKQTEILSPPDAGKVEKEAPISPDVSSRNAGMDVVRRNDAKM